MKNIPSILALVLFGLTMTSVKIYAQWELTNAPEGVYVYDFAVSGTSIYAGIDTDSWVDSGGTVLLSTDNGANWTDIGIGLTAPEVWALAISGANIFAGTFGGGVFLSTDNGASWTGVSSGLTDSAVTSLAINGINIFAGTYGGGVFRSTDDGENWVAVNTGLTNLNVWSLTIGGSNVFVGTEGGVFLSTDNGTNWTDISTGLPGGLGWHGTIAASGTNLFAGTGGVFLSTNSGASWIDVSEGLPNRWVFDLAVLDTIVFALTNWGGVSVSIDNGANWTLVNEGLVDTLVLAIGVSNTYAFAGGESGSLWRRPVSEMISAPTSVENVTSSFPQWFTLHQNYPNPFNPSSTIQYDLPQGSDVSLIVYDIVGREVAKLVDGYMEPGYRKTQWDGRSASGREIPSSIYIARLVTPEYSKSIKMVLLK